MLRTSASHSLIFGARANRTRSPQSTRISSLGLDGLGNPHLRLCSRASLGFHLTSRYLTTVVARIVSFRDVNWYAPRIDATHARSCSSNQYLQLAFVHTQPSRFEHLRRHFSKSGKLALSPENQETHQVVCKAEVRQVQSVLERPQ